MNSYQAKKIPLVQILSRLGYSPLRKDKGGIEWVYNSPFRDEKIPSLFVNIEKNIWNDFGDRGGNVLDFVMHHENTDLRGALAFLDNLYAKSDFKPLRTHKTKKAYKTAPKEETLILDGVMPLKSPVLENYLQERVINIEIAKIYLKVVQFHHKETGKKYFGIGVKNLSDAYEVRNPTLKAVVGKKDISFFEGKKGSSSSVAIFESFIDFLSFLTDKKKNKLESDVIILNSANMAERARDFVTEKDYQKVYTFFDNDRAGENAKDIFSQIKNDIISCNHIYKDFKDYNDYLVSITEKSKTKF